MISNACGKNGMVYGQYLDINTEKEKINKKLIEDIHKLKTGKLIECAVMLGQIGNEDQYVIEHLANFSKKVGLAFQITDDILEVTSSKEILGKSTNSDRKNCKATYTNVLGLEESIKESKKLTQSAIQDVKAIELEDADLLIELAKYITYRER